MRVAAVAPGSRVVVLSEYLRYVLAGDGSYRAALLDNRWLLFRLILKEVVEGGSDRFTMAEVKTIVATSSFLRLGLLRLATAAEIADAVGLAAAQATLGRHYLLRQMLLHAWRAREMIYTGCIAFDCVILL